MLQTVNTALPQLITPARLEEIDCWIARYPADQRQSAVMAALRIIQEEYGYLTATLMDACAEYLGMPPIAVYEVATFYSMYNNNPVGRHIVNVCTNISCKLRDSDRVVKHLEQTLAVEIGSTTSDGRFTLRAVECLGACVNAPMMQVDKDYHEHLTPEKIDRILEQYE